VARVGVVTIGRNEGERLRACLESVIDRVANVVYVDSGSTDGSVELARSVGADVVELDMSIPFTAARARNAGYQRLMQSPANVDYVQFVDGDCEVAEGWVETASKDLDDHPEAAAVWGHLRERYPDASVYNKLASMEWDWDLPFGDVETFGGIVMVRVEAIQQAGGYNPAIIAGEEREFAARLLEQGWRIRRIDAEMVLHDVAMNEFSQWWRRSKRTGHAYAEGNWTRRHEKVRYWQSELRSILIWGIVLPLVILLLVPCTLGLSLLLIALYFIQAYRIKKYMLSRGYPSQDAGLYARHLVLGKIPNGLGVIKYHYDRLRGRTRQIIEYK